MRLLTLKSNNGAIGITKQLTQYQLVIIIAWLKKMVVNHWPFA